ncbi:MAG: hypothetical protein U0840_24045 [Gemmataceae bacterium]
MPVELVCGCGRHLRASEHHVGRRIRCPGCGTSLVVTAATEAPTRTAPLAGPSRTGTRVMVGLLAVALLGALLAASWWILNRSKGPSLDDLSERDLIPPNAQGMLRVRVAELWATEAMREAIAQARTEGRDDPGAFLERQTSLSADRVESATFVILDVAARLGWTVLRTRDRYDPVQVRSRLLGAVEQRHAGFAYWAGDDSDGKRLAVCPLGPTLLLAGSEVGVQRCLTHLAGLRQQETPQLASLADRLDDPAPLVGAYRPEPSSLEGLRALPSLAALAEVRQVEATGNVNEKATLVAAGQTESPAQAKQAQSALRNTIRLMRAGLALQALEGPEKAAAMQKLGQMLNQIEIQVEGNDVRATLTTEAETVLGVLPALPRLLSGE